MPYHCNKKRNVVSVVINKALKLISTLGCRAKILFTGFYMLLLSSPGRVNPTPNQHLYIYTYKNIYTVTYSI